MKKAHIYRKKLAKLIKQAYEDSDNSFSKSMTVQQAHEYLFSRYLDSKK